MALITSLLLLAVVTILAVGMFRSFGTQERIAGNLREKQRALHAAESAQQFAEFWLSSDDHAATLPVDCDRVLDANLGQSQICSNPPGSVATPPLQVGGVDAGFSYNAGNSMEVTTTAGRHTYYKAPRFYIHLRGLSPGADSQVYQIDAVGYGADPSAVAVVESTFVVTTGVVDRGAP